MKEQPNFFYSLFQFQRGVPKSASASRASTLSWVTSKMKTQIAISFLLGTFHTALYINLCLTFFAFYQNNLPKGDLISESFSLCLKSPKKDAKLLPWPPKEKILRGKEEQSGGTVDWPFMLCTLNEYVTGKIGKIFHYIKWKLRLWISSYLRSVKMAQPSWYIV